VTDKGQVKIMDFGLAKIGGGAQLTKDHSTLGTAAYMSPEQARGEEVDQRSDIWSFGVVLYEMLTGQLPFPGDYEQAVIYAILNEDPEPVAEVRPDVPEGLQQIVARTLVKEREERYQTTEFLADLYELTAPAASQNGSASFSKLIRRPQFAVPAIVLLLAMCDRVSILNKGLVARQGTLSELTDHTVEYRISAAGNLAAIRQEIEKLGGKISRGRIVVSGQDAGRVNTLIDLLRSRNYTIEAVEPHRFSLEDIFVEIVGDAIDGETAPPTAKPVES